MRKPPHTNAPEALKAISNDVQPLSKNPEPRLVAELDRLERSNDVTGMTALYDYFVACANIRLAITNMPRAQSISDFLEDDSNHVWAKAFTVADRLKQLRPNNYNSEYRARALIDAAFSMGCSVKEVAAITQHLSWDPD